MKKLKINKYIIRSLLLTLIMTSCGYRQNASSPQGKGKMKENVRLIGYTPIKDQGKSDLGWAYAMLATIESEHIMKGDSINLSIAYITRKMLHEKAVEYYFSKGERAINMKAMGATLIKYINQYGAEPYDSYETPKDIDYQVLCRKIEQICDGAITQKIGLEKLNERLDDLFDNEIGYPPAQTIYMLGAEYTPLEFAHSVCYPEEYVSLTSFSHHPFREYFALEIPENSIQNLFLNLPIDELMLHIREAVSHHHPVCWEGDISNTAFSDAPNGYVDLPASKLPVTQASRQREFEQLHTSNDHAMEIIGTFSEGKKTFYVCKNSQGKEWGCEGLVYLSEDYIKLKTTAVYMSESAFIYDQEQGQKAQNFQ